MNDRQWAASAASQTSSSVASGTTVTDVFEKGTMEQGNVLGDDRQGLVQALLRDETDILAVDADLAAIDIVEALQAG